MIEFKCTKRNFEKGLNWAWETREYILMRNWKQRFHKFKHNEISIADAGQFYFDNDKNTLPQEGNKEYGSGLKPFTGQKIIDWILENTDGKVKMTCKREYSHDLYLEQNDHRISFEFSDEADLILMKLRWV